MRSKSDISFRSDHPLTNANWLSRRTFWYTNAIFRKGRRKDLDESDLTKPYEGHRASRIGERLAIYWNKELQRAKEHRDEPHLIRALFRCFMTDIISQGLLLFVMEVIFRFCQPIFLGLLLRYFDPENQENKEPAHPPTYLMRLFHYWQKNQSAVHQEEAFVYASGVLFCCLINVLVMHNCFLAIQLVGMKFRMSLCSLIYRKTLRLDLTALRGPTVGNVVNLMSNDVNRFDMALMHIHYLWIAPTQMILALYIIYKEVGVAAVVGISVMLFFIPMQAWFGTQTSFFRLRTAMKTDERVRQMNEIIQGMGVIKMYTWEHAFAKQVAELRRSEMEALRITCYIRGAVMSFIMFTTRLGIFLTVMTALLLHQLIVPEKVFVITSYYMILRQTMTLFFPSAIAQLAEINVAISRIKKFLLMAECSVGDQTPLNPQWKKPDDDQDGPFDDERGINIEESWAKIGDAVVLKNINLEMKMGQLAAVIGQVGSGKSCLLHLILGELQPCLGSIQVNGVVSYASQEPWLFAGSVRENILFGRPFEKGRYYAVIRACALIKDLKVLPFGDHTLVGEKGITLSGGQRARVNLARAVYKKADIYLFDDPLSAVDSQVGKLLFDKCINGYLSDKVVILVTHQLQFLSHISQVILMDEGSIAAAGSYSFLETTGLDFAEFLKNQLAVDTPEPDMSSKVNRLMRHLSVQSNLSLNVIDVEGQSQWSQPSVAEMRTRGKVTWGIYKEYFRAGGKCSLLSLMIFLFMGAQAMASSCDFFLAEWVNVEEYRHLKDKTIEDRPVLDVLSRPACIGVYCLLIGVLIVVALTRSFVFFTICRRASIALHDRMFASIITASMKFFADNTSGRILNRFANDLGCVDELLPLAMLDCYQILLNLVGASFVIVGVNFLLAIPTGGICVLFYFLRAFYLRTGRSVKRLEGICRSPIFAHLNATIQGLATVRSNGAEVLLTREFDSYLDDHSSAWFMFLTTTRAFGYWLDLICAGYIGVVTFSFLIFANNGSRVGLAVTQAFGLTGLFQWGMKQSAEIENQMTAVERVLEFTMVEHEPQLKSEPGEEPPEDWPSEGKIEFINLVMRYKPEGVPVLKSLNFLIHPQEKVGIVGRTGAGKSSLISALFRMAYYEGLVLVDELDIKRIGLHDLRGKISIIPQEPVLFSGTLRYNMDPFNVFDDEAIVQALVVVEIKAAMAEGHGCLTHLVSEGGTNISVGERQMICLARAILRNNIIIVLDEATANVDPKTDKFIQTTIRRKFATCTVLTIAHRLHTIMDSDRVLVMDLGQVVEFDHPHVLLQKAEGFLTQMVEKTGQAMAKSLKGIAKENYNLKLARK